MRVVYAGYANKHQFLQVDLFHPGFQPLFKDTIRSSRFTERYLITYAAPCVFDRFC